MCATAITTKKLEARQHAQTHRQEHTAAYHTHTSITLVRGAHQYSTPLYGISCMACVYLQVSGHMRAPSICVMDAVPAIWAWEDSWMTNN